MGRRIIRKGTIDEKIKILVILMLLCTLCGCSNKSKNEILNTTAMQPLTDVNDEGEAIMMRDRRGEQAQ